MIVLSFPTPEFVGPLLPEDCETPCAHCQVPIKYQWCEGIIVPPGTMLISDWLFHFEWCWKDPEPDAMPHTTEDDDAAF